MSLVNWSASAVGFFGPTLGPVQRDVPGNIAENFCRLGALTEKYEATVVERARERVR
jgi:hypothetical protein